MLVTYRWNRSTEKLGHSDNLINLGSVMMLASNPENPLIL